MDPCGMVMDCLRSHNLVEAYVTPSKIGLLRWYPCAPGALPFPGMHAFQHPVWDTRSDTPPPGPGCTRWLDWRGKRYPAPPGQHFHGPLEYFQHGIPDADLELPVVVPTEMCGTALALSLGGSIVRSSALVAPIAAVHTSGGSLSGGELDMATTCCLTVVRIAGVLTPPFLDQGFTQRINDTTGEYEDDVLVAVRDTTGNVTLVLGEYYPGVLTAGLEEDSGRRIVNVMGYHPVGQVGNLPSGPNLPANRPLLFDNTTGVDVASGFAGNVVSLRAASAAQWGVLTNTPFVPQEIGGPKRFHVLQWNGIANAYDPGTVGRVMAVGIIPSLPGAYFSCSEPPGPVYTSLAQVRLDPPNHAIRFTVLGYPGGDPLVEWPVIALDGYSTRFGFTGHWMGQEFTSGLLTSISVPPVLPVSAGGTGLPSVPVNDLVVGTGFDLMGLIPPGGDGLPLLSGGLFSPPDYGMLQMPAGGTGTGSLHTTAIPFVGLTTFQDDPSNLWWDAGANALHTNGVFADYVSCRRSVLAGGNYNPPSGQFARLLMTSGLGVVQAFDFGAFTWRPLYLDGSEIHAVVSGAEKFTVDGAGVSFFGSPTAPLQTVTGSTLLNPALGSLIAALAAYGLIIDATT